MIETLFVILPQTSVQSLIINICHPFLGLTQTKLVILTHTIPNCYQVIPPQTNFTQRLRRYLGSNWTSASAYPAALAKTQWLRGREIPRNMLTLSCLKLLHWKLIILFNPSWLTNIIPYSSYICVSLTATHYLPNSCPSGVALQMNLN